MAFVTNSLNFPNLSTKSTPVAADLLLIADSAASNALKQATLSSIQGAVTPRPAITATGGSITTSGD